MSSDLVHRSPTARILTIQPAESLFDLVDCQLDQVDLNQERGNYVVHQPIDPDDAELDHCILCNDALMPVSEHTYFFLWTLRNQPDHRMRRVWSPWICINSEAAMLQTTLSLILQKCFQRISLAPSYRYTPLVSPDSVRVLELDKPPVLNGLLNTKMRDVSLSDQPVYYYLDVREELTSDTWPDKQPIICNRRMLSIPKPFHDIMASVLSRGPRAFWIPALCVDRKSTVDRDHHATLTEARIRKEAKETIGIMQPRFTYLPLPDTQPHIRLLKIVPASSLENTLIVDIGHFPLDACPEFVALSYVWGSPDPKWMVCTRDGRYIVCTSSLRTALCQLRQRGELVVWADAVCINQGDNEEKSKQVLLMEKIYKRAKRVVVDLGVNCNNENHRVCRVYPRVLINSLALTGRVLAAIRPDRPALDNREYAEFGIPDYSHKAWSGWRAMRSMPWFTRSWIVQEVAAGKEVIVLYNGKSYNWKDMDMANRVTANEQVDLHAYVGKMNMTNMGDLQTIQPRLFHLLTTFRSLDATDPRDKIYAFRGLAIDQDQLPLPDYSKSVEEVYLEHAAFFIKQGFGLQLLANAGMSRSSRPLPSWVPDWSFSTSWQTFNYTHESSWVALEGSHKKAPQPETGIVLGQNDSRSLIVPGYFLDEIIDLNSPVSNTFRYNESAEVASQIDLEILETYRASLRFSHDISESTIQSTLLGRAGHQFNPLSGFYRVSEIVGTEPPGPGDEQSVKTFDMSLRERLSNRRVCWTRDERILLVPAISENGDLIVWLKGVMAPMVVRRKGDDHVLIGDAYLDGFMGCDGESMVESLGLDICTIILS